MAAQAVVAVVTAYGHLAARITLFVVAVAMRITPVGGAGNLFVRMKRKFIARAVGHLEAAEFMAAIVGHDEGAIHRAVFVSAGPGNRLVVPFGPYAVAAPLDVGTFAFFFPFGIEPRPHAIAMPVHEGAFFALVLAVAPRGKAAVVITAAIEGFVNGEDAVAENFARAGAHPVAVVLFDARAAATANATRAVEFSVAPGFFDDDLAVLVEPMHVAVEDAGSLRQFGDRDAVVGKHMLNAGAVIELVVRQLPAVVGVVMPGAVAKATGVRAFIGELAIGVEALPIAVAFAGDEAAAPARVAIGKRGDVIAISCAVAGGAYRGVLGPGQL